MIKWIKPILALSILPQIVVVKILANYPLFIEKYYSNGLYVWLSKIFRGVFGWIPFSMGDIFYTIAILLIFRFFILHRKKIFRQPRTFFKEVFIVLSLAYFVFHVLWGLNYYRQPLSKSLHLENDYTTHELVNFTKNLIEKSNEIHFKITKNDSLAVEIPYSKSEIYKMTANGYSNLSQKLPRFTYELSSIKHSVYSLPLTYMGYGGYINPFTNEAQVNSIAFNFKYPTVSCHEQAHQIGYAAENEANFIGYLASIHNDDIYFQYSGYVFVLGYCLREIKKRDKNLVKELTGLLNPGIIENYNNVAKFWSKYETKAEVFFKETFNTFLKANNQKQGIKSYSNVVSLLVNYHKKNPL